MLRAVLAATLIFVTSTSSYMFTSTTRCVRKLPISGVTWEAWSRNHQCRVLFSSTDTASAIGSPHTGEFTSISFFKFVPIPNPQEIVDKVKLHFSDTLGVRGTVLLAKEGVNAQMMVPKLLVDVLPELLSQIDANIFRDVNINVGQTIDYETSDIPFPFKRLIVREKHQILTDGLLFADESAALDWNDAGPEVPPAQWHQELRRLRNADDTSSTIVLDCRNGYESEMGTFDHATSLNTTKFSETWLAIAEKLAGVPKETRILTFCTGGIRCVKVPLINSCCV